MGINPIKPIKKDFVVYLVIIYIAIFKKLQLQKKYRTVELCLKKRHNTKYKINYAIDMYTAKVLLILVSEVIQNYYICHKRRK